MRRGASHSDHAGLPPLNALALILIPGVGRTVRAGPLPKCRKFIGQIEHFPFAHLENGSRFSARIIQDEALMHNPQYRSGVSPID